MGNQGTASSGLRSGVEIIRSGVLGDVKEVHVWTDRPSWPQGIGRPKGNDAVPSYVHWDLFLGPAPERPYVNDVYHRFNWRGWIDFGTGALGDMACHVANMSVMALDLFDPVSIEPVATSGIVENETYPNHSVISYQFPQRGQLAPCRMIWYDGKLFPPEGLFQGEKRPGNGSLIVGTQGTLLVAHGRGSAPTLLPSEKFKDYSPPAPTLPRLTGQGQGPHFAEWVAAIRGGEPAMSNFDYASRLTETVLLGNVAVRAGTKIEWDAANARVTNVPEANAFLTREYRAGWSV
jgi:predicted dehydrogenase